MSNRKLVAATAGHYGVPRFPSKLSLFQRLYETRRHKNHPVTEMRLRQFAEDLKMVSFRKEEVSFRPNFTTDDGTHWYAVGFRYVTGRKYYLAFPQDEDPKHHDGTVSAQHVALYCTESDVSEEELNYVAQATYAIFHTFD